MRITRIKKIIQRTYEFDSLEDSFHFIENIQKSFEIEKISSDGLSVIVNEVFYDEEKEVIEH